MAAQAGPPLPPPEVLQGAAQGTADAARLTREATSMVQGFFSRPEREGVRNLSAGDRGIFITPSADRAGFVVGAEHADGLLLVRHGVEWSDPIFVTLSNFDVGFLAGVSRSELLMYVLTDRAVRQFLSGAGRVSGSGGFVLGDWGVGGLGAGGISGGVQALTIETSRGLFAGGGFGSAQMRLNDAMNRAAYGAGFDASRVLAERGGTFAPPMALRGELAQAVRHGAGQ